MESLHSPHSYRLQSVPSRAITDSTLGIPQIRVSTGFCLPGRVWYISAMSTSSASSSGGSAPRRGLPRSLLGLIGTGLRKIPTTFVLVLIGLFIFFRYADESQTPEQAEFEAPAVQEEPQPPPDLPANVSPELWTCVYRTDTQLSASRWADIYYGMEASDFGRSVAVMVSQKWAELSASQQTTVVELVASTWQTNSQNVSLFAPGVGLEHVTLKRAADKMTVAVWTPEIGVELVDAPETTQTAPVS